MARIGAGSGEPIREPARQRPGSRAELHLNFPPRQQPVVDRGAHMVVVDLGAQPAMPSFGDPVAVAHRADRRHVDQRLAQPHSGQHVSDLRRRCVRERGADLHAFLGVGNLQLPAVFVVAVAPPQQHPMRLQVAVGGVVVRAVQVDRPPLHVRADHDVIETGQREMLVDLPLQFAFKHFFHGKRLPATGAGETSRQHDRKVNLSSLPGVGSSLLACASRREPRMALYALPRGRCDNRQ